MRKVIKRMIREKVPTHFLDSGGYYGYIFDSPVPDQLIYGAVRKYGGEWDWDYYISLGHFLDETLGKYLPKATARYRRLVLECDSWDEAARRFCEGKKDLQVIGHDNTYNHDCDLDQVFDYFLLGDKAHTPKMVIIRSHNGCDVRGGYSDPYIFEVDDWLSFLDYTLEVSCNCGEENLYHIPDTFDYVSRYPNVVCSKCGELVTVQTRSAGFVRATIEPEKKPEDPKDTDVKKGVTD